jgi:predicted helicase
MAKEFEDVRFKIADKKMGEFSQSDIKKIISAKDQKEKQKIITKMVDRNFKEAGNEASKAMGGYKNGGKVCKLATKGKGRAYGKNS